MPDPGHVPVNPAPPRDRAGQPAPARPAGRRKASGVQHVPNEEPGAFVKRMHTGDPFAEELGEDFVRAATSGEDERTESREELALEEIGGPFVISSANTEIARDEDEANPPEATREPFPKT